MVRIKVKNTIRSPGGVVIFQKGQIFETHQHPNGSFFHGITDIHGRPSALYQTEVEILRRCPECGKKRMYPDDYHRSGQGKRRRICRECYSAKIQETRKRYTVDKAGAILHAAIARGEVEKAKACQICGSKENLDAHHHNGYEDPLDFVTVCRSCHMAWHGAEKRKDAEKLSEFRRKVNR
jgi:DNA-directed RNA polymerase subunit M/transcription elongation factor TFIIS